MQVDVRQEQGEDLFTLSVSRREAEVLLALLGRVEETNSLVGQWVGELASAGISIDRNIQFFAVSEDPAIVIKH